MKNIILLLLLAVSLTGYTQATVLTTSSGGVPSWTSITGLPYTYYSAVITQTSTTAPSAVGASNTLGGTMTWARTSAGVFTLTSNGTPFTAGKTVVIMSAPILGLVSYVPVVTSTSVITLTTNLNSVIATVLTGVATDAELTNALFEIRVYP
jgi:hypothetical protein